MIILMSIPVICIIHIVGFPIELILVDMSVFLMLQDIRRNTGVAGGYRGVQKPSREAEEPLGAFSCCKIPLLYVGCLCS